jgi:hypothetical protein
MRIVAVSILSKIFRIIKSKVLTPDPNPYFNFLISIFQFSCFPLQKNNPFLIGSANVEVLSIQKTKP